jgi:UDP-N-acetylmuramoyl-L-alanyl-D-glutamate--2,6-diaminopimelate ligase
LHDEARTAPGLDALLRTHAELPSWPGGEAPRLAGLTADSRAVAPGFLFAALPGAKADGRAFIGAAVAAGAVAVLAPQGTTWPEGVPARPLLTSADPRRALALLAAAWHGAQPRLAVAVTGTNGKTSSVDFLRQIWTLAGMRAASLGTLGVIAEGEAPGPSLTTPDPAALHATLARLARSGTEAVAMEASSHGLDQRRLDGVVLAAAGFANLTRDHLDYHGDMAGYRAAKLRLFDTLLPDGAVAVANAEMEAPTLEALRGIATRRGLRLLTVGEGGEALRLVAQRPLPEGQEITVEGFGRREALLLPLPGRFQADNVLMAATLAIATGLDAAGVLALLPRLRGVRGRMELARRLPNGAAVYVDYAHTPDALERLLAALRPHVAPGARLHVLFGAGGDRDPGKRPLMGAACAKLADICWVTDDNPRSEDPAAIRRAVLAGCLGGVAPEARGEVIDAGDRAGAIARALMALRPGDVLAVAGKGHESGQTIGGVTHPFDDAEMVRSLAA